MSTQVQSPFYPAVRSVMETAGYDFDNEIAEINEKVAEIVCGMVAENVPGYSVNTPFEYVRGLADAVMLTGSFERQLAEIRKLQRNLVV